MRLATDGAVTDADLIEVVSKRRVPPTTAAHGAARSVNKPLCNCRLLPCHHRDDVNARPLPPVADSTTLTLIQ
jgi:hypothetical protein